MVGFSLQCEGTTQCNIHTVHKTVYGRVFTTHFYTAADRPVKALHTLHCKLGTQFKCILVLVAAHRSFVNVLQHGENACSVQML